MKKLIITSAKSKFAIYSLQLATCIFLLTALAFLARPTVSFAQQNTGIGTLTPNPSAKLDVVSTTQGVLVPRLNTAQMNAIALPANGLIIYNTDSSCFCYYNSISWLSLCNAGGGSGPAGPTGPTGAASTVPGPAGPTGAAGTNGTNGTNG